MLDLNIIKADTNYADVTFFKIPKSLFDEKVKNTGLSLGAKLLFTLLFDRVSLSIKNSWVNKNNEVFVYFTQDEAMEYLECSKKTVAKFYNELEEKGLISRVHQGFSKASKIYIKDISSISTNTKKAVFKVADENIIEKNCCT